MRSIGAAQHANKSVRKMAEQRGYGFIDTGAREIKLTAPAEQPLLSWTATDGQEHTMAISWSALDRIAKLLYDELVRRVKDEQDQLKNIRDQQQ